MTSQQTTRHTTECAVIAAKIPAKMRNMKATEIVDAIMDAEIAKAPGGKPGAGMRMIKATFDAVADPQNWKAPFYARFPKDERGAMADEWVKAAVIWYHGSQPYASFVGVYSQGYACD